MEITQILLVLLDMEAILILKTLATRGCKGAFWIKRLLHHHPFNLFSLSLQLTEPHCIFEYLLH